MWINYANNHSGICCVFEMTRSLDFWPVLYCNKDKADFTQDIVKCISSTDINSIELKKLGYLPFVLKDQDKYSQEQEVRLLRQDPFDSKEGVFNGKIFPEIKKRKHYNGTTYNYDDCCIKLIKIIIGKNTVNKILKKIQNMNLPIEFEESITE